MKKKKNKNAGLKGFEEVLDLIPSKTTRNYKAVKGGRKDRLNDNFALLNFLEIEKDRLEKVSELLERKLDQRVEYSQLDALIKKQEHYRDELKTKIKKRIQEPENIFFKQISSLYNRLF